MDRIPVILVTGFLGSGKTTFLRRMAQRHPCWNLVFLVNELADRDVDGATLGITGRPTQSIVGGSLFCECKASEFIKVMREVVLARHREIPLDAVFIETSGVADPEAIGRLIGDFGLGEQFAVKRIVTVVSPRRFLTLAGNLPVVDAQIAASDLVVVNKTDLADEETLLQVEQEVRRRNASCGVVRALHCDIEFTLVADMRTLPQGELSTCEANPFTAETRTVASPVDRAALDAWLRELPASVLRVKGVVPTNGGWIRVEASVDGISQAPSRSSAEPGLVAVVADEDEAVLREIWARFPEPMEAGVW